MTQLLGRGKDQCFNTLLCATCLYKSGKKNKHNMESVLIIMPLGVTTLDCAQAKSYNQFDLELPT